MNILKQYVSGSWGDATMSSHVGDGGWYYGNVSGSYALTAIHYFKGGLSGGYSLCGMWGPRSVDVFGPVTMANYSSVPRFRTSVCGTCRPMARKLGINPPESFVIVGKAISLPTFEMTVEVKVDVKKLAGWIRTMVEDYVDDYIDDNHSEVADTDAAGDLLLDWIEERIRTGA